MDVGGIFNGISRFPRLVGALQAGLFGPAPPRHKELLTGCPTIRGFGKYTVRR